MSIYGNPVTLGPRWMTAQKVSILPHQNLHGYDHPWPAGGGKNLFDISALTGSDVMTQYGSTWTPGLQYATMSVNDGTITITRNTKEAAIYVCIGKCYAGTPIAVSLKSSGLVYSVDIRPDPPTSPTSARLDRYVTNGATSVSCTFTPTEDGYVYLEFYRNSQSYLSGTATDIQLESGSQATPFAPYSNICPISGWEDCQVWVSPTPNPADGTTYQTLFGNPPGTVYGGTLDVTNGMLTVDRAMVDMGTLNWQAGTGDGIFWIYSTRAPATYWVPPASDDDAVDFICSKYQALPFSGYNTKASGIWWHIGSGEYIGFRDPNYVNWTTANVKSDLSGETLIVRLKSPVTYQLTSQQISFLGNQYFGANCGPVLIKVGK